MSLHPSTCPPLYSVISISVWRVLFALRPAPLLLPPDHGKGLHRSAPAFTHKSLPAFECSPCTSYYGSAPSSLRWSSRCDEHAKHIRGSVNGLIGEEFCYLLISISCLLFLLIRHLNSWLFTLDDDEYDALPAIQAGNLYANFAFEMR